MTIDLAKLNLPKWALRAVSVALVLWGGANGFVVSENLATAGPAGVDIYSLLGTLGPILAGVAAWWKGGAFDPLKDELNKLPGGMVPELVAIASLAALAERMPDSRDKLQSAARDVVDSLFAKGV